VTTIEQDEAGSPTLSDFRLLIEDPPEGGYVDSTVPMGWCMSREAHDELIRRGAVNAQMVLVIAANRGSEAYPIWTAEEVTIVPFTAELEYISFVRPGLNRVFGMVVWEKNGDVKRLKRMIYNLGLQVDRWNGSMREYFLDAMEIDFERLHFIAQLDVDVPAEMFGSVPTGRRSNFVGKFYKGKPKNECQFFWRTVGSCIKVVPYMVVGFIVRLVQAVVLGFIGFRKTNFAAVVHPMKYGMFDVSEQVRYGHTNTWWTHDKRGEPREPYWWVLQPVSYVVLATALFAAGSIHVTKHHGKEAYVAPLWGWSWPQSLLVAVIVHAVVIVWFAAIFFLGLGAEHVVKRFKDRKMTPEKRAEEQRRRDQAEEKRKADRERAQTVFQRQLSGMVCDTSSKPVAVAALPKEKQTIHLRVKEYKTKHCKAYPR